jgi:hypothetical protein
MTARERDAFEAENLQKANAKAGNGVSRKREPIEPNLDNFRSRLVARHIVENGQKVFANERGEEILGQQPAAVLDRLFTVARRLSGFSEEDVEALSKNSVATAGDEQSSASPESSASQ